MLAPDDKMQLLRAGLKLRFDMIKKKTLCRELSFSVHGSHGEFDLVAKWPDGRVSRYYFDRRYVLGNTASMPPINQRLVKGICSFTADAITHFKVDRGL